MHNLDNLKQKLAGTLTRHQDSGFVWALSLSAWLRFYFAVLTVGTYDVEIWQRHVNAIIGQGIFNYYTTSLGTILTFSHPPLLGASMVALDRWCEMVNLNFGIVFRLILGASDFLTAALLLHLLRRYHYAKIRVIVYLLAPVTVILSSYHGNMDCLVALFSLAALASFAGSAYALAGFLFGLGISVRWIIVLAGPALFFGIPTVRDKMKFLLFGAFAICVGYGWWMAQHPMIVFRSVFGYSGQMFFTGAGEPIWGNQIVLRPMMQLFGIGTSTIGRLLDFLFHHNRELILIPIFLFSWLRRRHQAIQDIGITIAGVFCIFYAATNFWAYQYFAWAVPFYFFLDWKRCSLLVVLTSSYIYGSYSYFCGTPSLSGVWDFIGHPQWPISLLALRDIVMIGFIYIAIEFIVRAAIDYRANRMSDRDLKLSAVQF
jgi:hypothetical protein